MVLVFRVKHISRIYITTKSPPDQCSISKIKIKEFDEDIKHLNEYENAVKVFDGILDTSNTKYIDHFLLRGHHSNLDI